MHRPQVRFFKLQLVNIIISNSSSSSTSAEMTAGNLPKTVGTEKSVYWFLLFQIISINTHSTENIYLTHNYAYHIEKKTSKNKLNIQDLSISEVNYLMAVCTKTFQFTLMPSILKKK